MTWQKHQFPHTYVFIFQVLEFVCSYVFEFKYMNSSYQSWIHKSDFMVMNLCGN